MKRAAYSVGDGIWIACLWVKRMRRDKNLDSRLFRVLPERFRERMIRSHMKQERFALIFGRRIVRGLVYILMMYIAVACAYWLATYAQAEGWLSLPESASR